jgi:hypothetical protein
MQSCPGGPWAWILFFETWDVTRWGVSIALQYQAAAAIADFERLRLLDDIWMREINRSAAQHAEINRLSEPVSGLADVVYALTELAAGRTPERSRLLAGALALSALVQHGEPDPDFHDAVAGLNAWAAGGLELDDRDRARAGHLATVVQRRALGI